MVSTVPILLLLDIPQLAAEAVPAVVLVIQTVSVATAVAAEVGADRTLAQAVQDFKAAAAVRATVVADGLVVAAAVIVLLAGTVQQMSPVMAAADTRLDGPDLELLQAAVVADQPLEEQAGLEAAVHNKYRVPLEPAAEVAVVISAVLAVVVAVK